MQKTRGPAEPASSMPQAGNQRGTAASSLTRLYTLAFAAAGPFYLLWRATDVGTRWQLALSVPFLWIEMWTWLQIICLRHQVAVGNSPTSTDGDTDETLPGSTTDFDVVVTVQARSNADDVERTLLGLAATDNTRTITVLSTQPDLQTQLPGQLTDRLPNLHFRSSEISSEVSGGNSDALKSVLDFSRAPWVLWLDAGQVPMPTLAASVQRHLNNDRVAVCQLASRLLNPESLVQVTRDGDEEALEHELIGEALARRGRAPWHGPGSLIRRGALSTASNLEDRSAFNVSWCAIELQRNGWEVAYEGKPLVRVPAADSLRPYLSRRRDRSLAVLEQLGYAFTLPDVPWAVRRTALARAVSVTHGLRQLAMVAVLIGSLLSGKLPIADTSGASLALMTGYAGAAMLARRSLSGRSMAFGDWVRHGWRTLGADIAALLPRLAIPIELRRRARSGQPNVSQHSLSGRLQLPIVAFGLLQVALAARAFSTIQPTLLPPMTRGQSLLVILASTVVTVQLIDVLGGLTRPHGRRRSIRVPLKSDITVGDLWGQTLDVTPFGVGAIVEAAPPVGATTTVTFAANDLDGSEYVVTTEGIIRSATSHRSGLVRVGIEFAGPDDDDRLALIQFCALGVAGPAQVQAMAAENLGQLAVERRTGDLVLVRSLAVASVLSAVGTLFVGPAAEPVVAADTGANVIPASFAISWPELAQSASTNATPDNQIEVRLHTNDWSDPLQTTADGNFARPRGPGSSPGPVHLAVTVGTDRVVLPIDDGNNIIELATLAIPAPATPEDTTATDTVSLVGPGGNRFTGTHGQVLVPGNYTIHLPSSNATTAVYKLTVNQGDVLRINPTGPIVDGQQP